ncbi:MAG: hypothetical protein GX335_03560 [Firmicutes bacterium]|nr:hypothetical protein [Bacillota bacterium]
MNESEKTEEAKLILKRSQNQEVFDPTRINLAGILLTGRMATGVHMFWNFAHHASFKFHLAMGTLALG